MPAPYQVEGRHFAGMTLYVAVLMVCILFCPRYGFCQLTHLDSLLAKKAAAHFDSLGQINFAGDSGLAPMLLLLGTSVDRSRQTLDIEQISASVIPSDSTGIMAIAFRGSLVRPNSQVATPMVWNDTSLINLSRGDEQSLETNSSRYVHIDRPQPRTFWEKTAEPAVVVLGAVLIAALFFLVRS